MRQSQSAVIERGFVLEGDSHATEPFEVAWAGEARWFAQFYTPAPGTTVSFQVQISPDGLHWMDHESSPLATEATGWATIPVERFGFWLRLKIDRIGGQGTPTVKIYLELKE